LTFAHERLVGASDRVDPRRVPGACVDCRRRRRRPVPRRAALDGPVPDRSRRRRRTGFGLGGRSGAFGRLARDVPTTSHDQQAAS